MSPSSLIGERGPPTPSTRPTSMPSGQLDPADEVGGGEAGLAELAGRHRRRPRRGDRCGGASTPCRGPRRWRRRAARRRSAPPARPTAPACERRRVTPATRSSRAVAAVHHVFPTSVPVPLTNTSVRGRVTARSGKSAASARREPVDLVGGVGGGQRDAQPRRCPAAPSAGGWRGRAGRRRAARRRPRARAPRRRRRTGTIGDGCPGRSRSTLARSRARSSSPSGERSTRERGERGGGVAGRRRGREDVGAGPVHEEVGERAAARRRTRRARRGSSTACRPAARRRSRVVVDVGAEHRVRLVEHEQRAVVRAHLGELVDRRDVAVHREHGVGHDDGAAARRAAREQLVGVGGVAVRVDRERRAGQASPSMIDAWLSSSEHDEHVRSGEGAEHTEVGGEPGGEQHRGLGVLPRRERGLELVVHRARADDQARRRRSRCPSGRSRRARRRTTAGCWVRPR